MKKEILIVSVDKDQKDLLKKRAKKLRISVANLIRNILVEYFEL